MTDEDRERLRQAFIDCDFVTIYEMMGQLPELHAKTDRFLLLMVWVLIAYSLIDIWLL